MIDPFIHGTMAHCHDFPQDNNPFNYEQEPLKFREWLSGWLTGETLTKIMAERK